MSTIVLQSPAESQFMEPLSLRLKMASPSTSQPFDQFPAKPTSEFARFGQNVKSFPELMDAWNFLNIPDHPAYSHSSGTSRISPLPPPPPPPPSSTSCSSSAMSDISLDLCTEKLGNETGCTEVTETNLFSSVSPPLSSNPFGDSSRRFIASKGARRRTFPPPLTTISGSESIHFRRHCEDGHLIIEAVRAPPVHSSLQAERSHGRLRLCFLREPAPAGSPEHLECRERAQEEEVEGDCLCVEEEEEEKVEIEEREEEGAGDVDEKNEKFGVRMGNVEMFARTGRSCREGDEAKGRSLDLVPFLVATS